MSARRNILLLLQPKSVNSYAHLRHGLSHRVDDTHKGIYTNHLYTSSTAQGGGGSFKNRKPIGEIGCCESPMAEQKH